MGFSPYQCNHLLEVPEALCHRKTPAIPHRGLWMTCYLSLVVWGSFHAYSGACSFWQISIRLAEFWSILGSRTLFGAVVLSAVLRASKALGAVILPLWSSFSAQDSLDESMFVCFKTRNTALDSFCRSIAHLRPSIL